MIARDRHNDNLKYKGWLVLILLAAAMLRLIALSDVPPGLTHDEADHGITAVSILNGARDIYFTIGHGREPLYDYLTALVMAGTGPTYLAGRLTAVFSSLVLLAGMAAWVRRAFSWQTAVLCAAGLAVSFWPLMAARQSLRSITLPALFVLVLFLFWGGLKQAQLDTVGHGKRLLSFAGAGLLLGLTFYTYIPARALWLILPLTLAYLWFVNRPVARRATPATGLMLLVAGLVALPLIAYLQRRPQAEVRIRELSEPLTAVLNGDVGPLWQNAQGGLGIIAISGDPFWRYNLPGRPLLPPLMALLFVLGLSLALWTAIRPFGRGHSDRHLWGAASFLSLLWLGVGLAPVLVTGADLSMTQAMGMQPVLYLFPAVAIAAGLRLPPGDQPLGRRRWLTGLVALFFLTTAVLAARDYFLLWAHAPEVRVQYETTVTTALRHVVDEGLSDVAISTITPGKYHSPAVAQMMAPDVSSSLRWFDGRAGLLLPAAATATLVETGFAAFAPELKNFLPQESGEHLIQPSSDLDSPLTVYQLDTDAWLAALPAPFTDQPPHEFGEAARLLGYELTQTSVAPGEELALISLWQLGNPLSEARIFVHLAGDDGLPVAQADLLAAPSEAWVSGDYLLQLHRLSVPANVAPGRYQLALGLYTCLDAACQQTQRFPVRVDGAAQGDKLILQDVDVTP